MKIVWDGSAASSPDELRTAHPVAVRGGLPVAAGSFWLVETKIEAGDGPADRELASMGLEPISLSKHRVGVSPVGARHELRPAARQRPVQLRRDPRRGTPIRVGGSGVYRRRRPGSQVT